LEYERHTSAGRYPVFIRYPGPWPGYVFKLGPGLRRDDGKYRSASLYRAQRRRNALVRQSAINSRFSPDSSGPDREGEPGVIGPALRIGSLSMAVGHRLGQRRQFRVIIPPRRTLV